MLRLAKSAELTSTFNQLTLIWNPFPVNLRRDILEPRPSTTIGHFLNQADFKTGIWMELAMRQPQQQQQRWQQESTPGNPVPDRHTNQQRNAPLQQA